MKNLIKIRDCQRTVAPIGRKAAEDSRTPKPCGMSMRVGPRASVLECGCPLPLSPTHDWQPLQRVRVRGFHAAAWTVLSLALGASLLATVGCRGRTPAQKANREFFTSGSREADQRASQRMAKEEQLAGSGEGTGEKGAKKAVVTKTGAESGSGDTTNKAAQVEGKLALFDRLGGEKGITAIVEDFTPRAMEDPRVNWARKGVTRGGLSIHRGKPVSWNPTPENVAQLKKHLVQFLCLATGGPAHYDGKGMRAAHASLHISNPEFDAAIGDLKASLDKLQIPNKEQKELLSIIESTRPEIVTER